MAPQTYPGCADVDKIKLENIQKKAIKIITKGNVTK